MPGLVTHHLAGVDVLKQINGLEIQCIIENNFKSYAIGTSGPDIFYFYKGLAKSNNFDRQRVYNLGTKLHCSRVNLSFALALQTLEDQDEYFDARVAYIAGWLMHYAIDKYTHPYICFNAGFGSEEADDNYRRLEAAIDTAMLKHLRNTNSAKYKPYHILDSDEKSIEAIYQIYDNVLANAFDCIIGKGIIKRSIKDMHLLYQLLNDPHGIKFQILARMEKRPYAYCSYIIKECEDEIYDVLNIKKTLWQHPCIEEHQSSASFLELYDSGLQYGILLLERFNRVVNKTCSISDFLTLIKDEDYFRGMRNDAPFVYSQDIFKQKE